MDWLKDKKNQPIVIGISAVILIGAIVGLLFQLGILGGASSGSPPVASGYPPSGVPGGPPPGVPSGPPLPGGPPGTPATQAAAKPATAPAGPTPPRKAVNVDPFKVPGVLVPKAALAATPQVSGFLPYVNIVRVTPKPSETSSGGARNLPPPLLPPEVSTTQRMSGVLFTDKGIVGLLETNGQTQQVYPGDMVNDGSARVLSIQSDGLTLRRQSDNRLVRVPLSSVSTGQAAAPPGGPDYPAPAPPDNSGDNQ